MQFMQFANEWPLCCRPIIVRRKVAYPDQSFAANNHFASYKLLHLAKRFSKNLAKSLAKLAAGGKIVRAILAIFDFFRLVFTKPVIDLNGHKSNAKLNCFAIQFLHFNQTEIRSKSDRTTFTPSSIIFGGAVFYSQSLSQTFHLTLAQIEFDHLSTAGPFVLSIPPKFDSQLGL